MSSIPTRTLPSGNELPVLGYGTYDLPNDGVGDALRTALDAGYTHVDTAEGYGNETAIGSALAEYDREELFLTSKVVPSNLHYEGVLDAVEASLDRLGTDYLDLYLIHWPNPAISLRETMQAFERLHEEGLVRDVGVSNFSAYQLAFARRVADVPIAVNQIEFHPWYYREDLLEYCREHDVVVEAAAPLARTRFLDDPVLADVADDHGVTPAQVALKWAVEKNVVVLPKSATADHIRSNAALFDWELGDDAVARLDDVDRMENVYMIDVDDDVYGIPA
jgi:diketogulonate reductase-like aldo/keto reductase